MSLGKTLLKVAIGVAIVKGVTSLTKGAGAAPSEGTTSAGRGTRYDGGQGGGLEDLLGEVLGSGRTAAPDSGRRGSAESYTPKDDKGGAGSLGDLLGQLSGEKRSTPRKTAPKGGIEDLLGQLTGAGAAKDAPVRKGQGGGVGDLLDQVMNDRRSGKPITLEEPEHEAEVSAALMLRAVIQAVKCDGELDDDERARLTKAMGDADAREVQAVQAELNRPVDVKGLARAVPAGLEPQVYVMSLMAINLDQKAEAEYLHSLAEALELSPQEVNALHDKARAPRLYR
jgi:uncharacterized membrane protein YebE (DUF533 family)